MGFFEDFLKDYKPPTEEERAEEDAKYKENLTAAEYEDYQRIKAKNLPPWELPPHEGRRYLDYGNKALGSGHQSFSEKEKHEDYWSNENIVNRTNDLTKGDNSKTGEKLREAAKHLDGLNKQENVEENYYKAEEILNEVNEELKNQLDSLINWEEEKSDKTQYKTSKEWDNEDDDLPF